MHLNCTDSSKEEADQEFGSPVLEVSLKMNRDNVISGLLPQIMKSAVTEKEYIVKEEKSEARLGS